MRHIHAIMTYFNVFLMYFTLKSAIIVIFNQQPNHKGLVIPQKYFPCIRINSNKM
eukprot:TRINITY_DN1232_c1_g1_i1.p1 TRINITY_DN1232_c1_g1~~TRINITY_DN1232_c1_g1_i1.p1  ORF type:complete len:55 (+),score=1.40 TRINITY_DN1232_c1_g1_i1:29-193(+)